MLHAYFTVSSHLFNETFSKLRLILIDPSLFLFCFFVATHTHTHPQKKKKKIKRNSSTLHDAYQREAGFLFCTLVFSFVSASFSMAEISSPSLPDFPTRRRECSSWVVTFLMGCAVFFSCMASNTYGLLLILQEKDTRWKFIFCLVCLSVQLVLLIMSFWGFFSVIFSSPGFVRRHPWTWVPVPAGPSPPSRALVKFFHRERMNIPLPLSPSETANMTEAHQNPTPSHSSAVPSSHALGYGELPSFLSSVNDWPSINHYMVCQRDFKRLLSIKSWQAPPAAVPPSAAPLPPPPENEAVEFSSETTSPCSSSSSPAGNSAMEKELKYCAQCQLYKPDFARHCSVCGRCVYHFDHHCYFVNNCIGRNNYRQFISFLLYGALCGVIYIPCTFVMLFAVDSRPWKGGDAGESVSGPFRIPGRKSPWIAVPVFEIPLGAFLCSMFVEHCILVALAMHTIDFFAAKRFGLNSFAARKYSSLDDIVWEDRKKAYMRDLFGTRHCWVKFLAPLPVRTDTSADDTP